MNEEEIKKEYDQINQIKKDIVDDYEKLDKIYSRNMLAELIFFLIVITFLLIFLFGL